MKKLTFNKYSGAGNDFVLIDKTKNENIDVDRDLIKAIAQRRTGVGSDGVLVINKIAGFDYSLEYFNSDGSSGNLCANGARCSIAYASTNKWIEKHASFFANGAEYSGEVLDADLIKFNLNPPGKIKLDFNINFHNQLVNAFYADTGSEHVVVFVNDILSDPNNPFSNYSDINKVDVFNFGKEIRRLPEFKPNGVNANFIQIKKDKAYIRTFEKGVEDETLACGTGTVAAAIILSLKNILNPPCEFITRGGDKLLVDFQQSNNIFTEISLTGPAKEIFSGIYSY
ncbi:MAG: diaminopimelate epimerase [Melioribacteraceae bacterium]|nr:diaminopimelate epimerase [Melioribacteraceae bacterium]MCF8353075.1 diaminopimelate epimerase [Melioribacteraceae bacterium]MCF8392779.1 diaminopimelate epimerase [Melioribacteraceae bacterium]MCF8418310.1 diaminopimelate epimerase [Melioribacteraceae bacterium]